MWDFFFYVTLFLLLAGGGVACALLVRGFVDGDGSVGALFGGGGDRRLEVIEQSSVDGKRKLVLIRRDRIEHLIMTGGPVDVVIETNIEPARLKPVEPITKVAEVRAPRSFGKTAVGE